MNLGEVEISLDSRNERRGIWRGSPNLQKV